MPNFCCNLLSISVRSEGTAAEIENVIRSLRGPNGPLDFETVLPIPGPLKDICRGGVMIDGHYHTYWRELPLPGGGVEKQPIPKEEIDRCLIEFGTSDPIEWCRTRWGTKWNAMTWGMEWDQGTFRFDTAWSPPLGFVAALSRKFSDIQFELCFVEPGVNMNGRVIYYRGQAWQTEDYDMESDAGIENAQRVGLTLPEPEDELEAVEA